MSTELATTEPRNPIMQLIGAAIEKGQDITELVQIFREERDYASKMAFDQALHKAQMEMRRIGVDANNPQTRSKYLTYSKMDGVLRPIYTDKGLSVSFNTVDCPIPEYLRVVAYVTHEGGYTRQYQIDVPADGKGAKGGDVMSKTHAAGSALSYGMRYLLKAIFNVAIGETDDDGNGHMSEKMQDVMFLDFRNAIESANTEDELRKAYTSAYKAADALGDIKAREDFIKAKDSRRSQL